MNDQDFLKWIYNRLSHLHGENENYDYMHRLKAIADKEYNNDLLNALIEISNYDRKCVSKPAKILHMVSIANKAIKKAT